MGYRVCKGLGVKGLEVKAQGSGLKVQAWGLWVLVA